MTSQAELSIELPVPCLVLLVGPTGAGKTTFAARHFRPTEVLSSDRFRALVADDEGDMSATADAFELLHLALARRLARGRLTVVDATNVQAAARRPLLALAARLRVPVVALVFDLPIEVAAERNRRRPGRTVPRRVLRDQLRDLERSMAALTDEGLVRIVVFRTAEEIEGVGITRR
jgi:predicted kinase